MTWQLSNPTASDLEAFRQAQSRLSLSYSEVGATTGPLPSGYVHDRNSAVIGRGEEAYLRAVEGLRCWKMFPADWTRIHAVEEGQRKGSVIAVVFKLLGIYWRSAARIVYEVEESATPGILKRSGFAYGTLPGHVECGEERFTVALLDNGDVVYELCAFSKPRYWMARLFNPLARRWQRKFVLDSQQALRSHVSG